MVKKTEYKVLITSDTHFGSRRALKLSRRPFDSVEEMDEVILKNINDTIEANGINKLIHLGDFGNMDFVKRIKCPVVLILGNYERKEAENLGITLDEYRDLLKTKYCFKDALETLSFMLPESYKLVMLCHEPMKLKKYFEETMPEHKGVSAGLFGHIHGRQFVKKFGIDVGVDAHHFYPLTAEDVEFYLNAIEQGYYDEEVFC